MLYGILLCFVIAIISYFIGSLVPVIGGPVFAIIIGMVVGLLFKEKVKKMFQKGIKFTSKKILQLAVVLLGFGLNLNVIMETGKQSLPIIISTVSISLLLAWIFSAIMKIDGKTAALVGIGSSICGGSAIAAAAPVLDAEDSEIAQAISVIFFFNVIAALLFPQLGMLLGFNSTGGEAFGIFAGTAINDTSSVTAAASTWDSIFHLGSQTLDKAVTVKLTRTLSIIPITVVLGIRRAKQNKGEGDKINWTKVFPVFIIFFILASVITTILTSNGVSQEVFNPIKQLSKFCIIMAMGAVGLNSNPVELFKKGGKPITLGFICWIGITLVSLFMQHVMNIW